MGVPRHPSPPPSSHCTVSDLSSHSVRHPKQSAPAPQQRSISACLTSSGSHSPTGLFFVVHSHALFGIGLDNLAHDCVVNPYRVLVAIPSQCLRNFAVSPVS